MGVQGKFIESIMNAVVQRDVDNRISNARLTEYTKLKDEIANRSSLQNAIVTLDVAAVGTLGGFVLGRKTTNSLLLLLLIPLSTALGLWWLDHAQTIGRIGNYIRAHLWPHIAEWERHPGEPLSYEDIVPKTSLLDRSTIIIPFFVIFHGPSIASILATVRTVRGTVWVLWSTDVTIFALAFALWLAYLRRSLPN